MATDESGAVFARLLPRRTRAMPDDVDDAELVARATRGDRDAYARLVDRHLAPLRKFLWRLHAPPADVDDLTQETFVTLAAALPDFRGASSFRTFVFGIAVNVVRRARRARRVTATLDGVDVPLPEVAHSTRLEAQELATRLHAAIARLPDAQREAFVLRHVEDMPSADVARVLDLPEGSVRRLVYEAREQLQWMLNAERVRERTR